MTAEGFQGWPLVCAFRLIDWQGLGEAVFAHCSQPQAASVFLRSSPHKPHLSRGSPGGRRTGDGQKTPGQRRGPACPRGWSRDPVEGHGGCRLPAPRGPPCWGWAVRTNYEGAKGLRTVRGSRSLIGEHTAARPFLLDAGSFLAQVLPQHLSVSTPGSAAWAPAAVCRSPRAPQVTPPGIRPGGLALRGV